MPATVARSNTVFLIPERTSPIPVDTGSKRHSNLLKWVQMPLLSAPCESTPVEWMPSCCAYPAAALGSLRFRGYFSGYSFMGYVDLSDRVSRGYQLLAVPIAGLVHLGMGSASQPD